MDLSILITNFNYDVYLDACIESCCTLAKTCSELSCEVLIVDDGSTDNSTITLKKYESALNVVYLENKGVEAAANSIYRISKGEFIVRVDADDLLDRYFLETIRESWEEAKKDDEVAFIYTNYEEIDENGKIIKSVELPDYCVDEIVGRGDFLATGTVMKRSALPSLLYKEDEKNCGLENYELILSLIERGYRGIHINAKGFYYRRHRKNMSNVKREAIIRYGNEMMTRFQFGEFRSNSNHPQDLVIAAIR